MRQAAILFVQNEGALLSLAGYRDRHFNAARKIGLICLTATVKSDSGGADHPVVGDTSFHLEALTTTALLQLIEQLAPCYDIKAILCYAGHASAMGEVGCVVAEVCRQTGRIYSPADAIAACNNKFLMREALRKRGVRSVSYAICSDEGELRARAEAVGYPLIAKPPYGVGSAFIKKCHDWAELEAHYRRFTSQYDQAVVADYYGAPHEIELDDEHVLRYLPGKSILLEQYIDGIEGSVECVIADEKVYAVVVQEKLLLTERSGTVLENLLIAPPVSFPQSMVSAIRDYAVDCIKAVGLRNAVVHLEFRLGAEGPVVIEINPRLGGLYVNSALRDIAGLDPYQIYLSILLGERDVHSRLSAACTKAAAESSHYAMFALFPEQSGFFRQINGLDSVKSDPAVIECEVACSPDSYVHADIEENYLLKGWAAVEGGEHALNLYERFVRNLDPEITL